MWGCGGTICCSVPQYGRVRGESGGTHTGTCTGTYTRMLHLPFSDLPLKKCPNRPGPVERAFKTGLRSSSPATGVIWALRAQSPKKVRKWVPGAGRKSRKRVEKESKIAYFSTFWTLFRLFFDFFDPRGREDPGTHFRTFFGLWARRTEVTPVAGEEDRKNRALFALKNGRFACSFLLLGIGLLQASKKANLSFKSPSPKPLLNQTESVLTLPIVASEIFQCKELSDNCLSATCL